MARWRPKWKQCNGSGPKGIDTLGRVSALVLPLLSHEHEDGGQYMRARGMKCDGCVNAAAAACDTQCDTHLVCEMQRVRHAAAAREVATLYRHRAA